MLGFLLVLVILLFIGVLALLWLANHNKLKNAALEQKVLAFENHNKVHFAALFKALGYTPPTVPPPTK